MCETLSVWNLQPQSSRLLLRCTGQIAGGLCGKWNELEYYRKSLAIKIKVPGGQHEMTALEQRKRVMTKAALIEEIVKMEWSMFSTVHNEGGKAACQMDRPMFTIMRTSQHQTWNEALLASYRDDLARAQEAGRNLMTEKYGRMMKSTFPEEYERIAAFFPPVSPETGRQIEEIVAAHVAWKEALNGKYPHLADRSRPTRTKDDQKGLASLETYTRAELETYSPKTIALYHAAIQKRLAEKTSEAEENLLNQVRQYGFNSLEAAERHFTTHEE